MNSCRCFPALWLVEESWIFGTYTRLSKARSYFVREILAPVPGQQNDVRTPEVRLRRLAPDAPAGKAEG
jgi:hypothetical protein